jgi:hypothetical protein
MGDATAVTRRRRRCCHQLTYQRTLIQYKALKGTVYVPDIQGIELTHFPQVMIKAVPIGRIQVDKDYM